MEITDRSIVLVSGDRSNRQWTVVGQLPSGRLRLENRDCNGQFTRVRIERIEDLEPYYAPFAN